MATNYANGYASIVKYDKNDDGTLMVFGKATDDTLDLDSQICDPAWLDTAMPAWFKSGGNIREMHGPSAAGVAKEYESKADGHYIGVHVVDPIAVKKVENRVYQGFSIGIKNPRVVRDNKAANGRIIDGSIIEVSLVDRPANPSAKLILAKSVEGESTLVQVEELHEYKAPSPSEVFKHGDHDQSDHAPGGGGGSSDKPSDSDSAERDRMESERNNQEVSNAQEQVGHLFEDASDLTQDLESNGEPELAGLAQEGLDTLNSVADSLTDAANAESLSMHTASIEDAVKDLEYAAEKFEEAEAPDLANGATDLANELTDYLSEIYGRGDEKSATTKTSKGSKMKKMERIKVLAKSLTADQILELTNSFAEISKSLDMPMNGESKVVPSRDEMAERYAAARKALDDITMECKANGYEDIEKEYGETAEQETAEGPAVAAETAEEEVEEAREQKPADEAKAVDAEEESEEDKKKKKVSKDDEKESEEDEAMKSLVDRAVKSAMELVRAEIDTLRAEKESAVEKSVKLETELTTALSKTVAGGPKRTATTYGAESNEYLVKALTYKAKADATTDPVLRKGYSDLYEEFNAKAFPAQNK
jgi:hypothetical protein